MFPAIFYRVRQSRLNVAKHTSAPANKESCLSVLRKTLSSGSTDSLMIRSCSIPESLACQWECEARLKNSPIKPRHCRHCSIFQSGERLVRLRKFIEFQSIHTNICQPALSLKEYLLRVRTDLCAAKYGRIRTELDEAQLVIKMLEDQLSEHGICVRWEVETENCNWMMTFSALAVKKYRRRKLSSKYV